MYKKQKIKILNLKSLFDLDPLLDWYSKHSWQKWNRSKTSWDEATTGVILSGEKLFYMGVFIDCQWILPCKNGPIEGIWKRWTWSSKPLFLSSSTLSVCRNNSIVLLTMLLNILCQNIWCHMLFSKNLCNFLFISAI